LPALVLAFGLDAALPVLCRPASLGAGFRPRCRFAGFDADLPALMMFAIVPRETSSRPVSACWPAGLLALMPGFFAASCLPHNLPLYWLLPILGFCRFVALWWLLASMPGFFAGWLVALLFCRPCSLLLASWSTGR
uniref:hypothetical protein n=1 Tax=Thiolapillus sp. TaxID=2017437 RepID=UPI003AF89BC4